MKITLKQLKKLVKESVLAQQQKTATLKEMPVEDPTVRAKRRMMDAFNRGGATEMINATDRRIQATSSPEKLHGIVDAIREILTTQTFLDARLKTALRGLSSEALVRAQRPVARPRANGPTRY
jgi:hypothetical protein